jgi:capsule polysaccharide export protein KpsE/RkpR
VDQGDVQSLTYSLQAQKVNLDAYQKRRVAVEPLVQKGYFPRNQLAEIDRQIGVTKVQIASIEAQIASKGGATSNGDVVGALKSQRDELKQLANELNATILKTPVVQAELNSLDRDYQSLQSEYQQSQAKLEDALTGERLEQDRQAERFEVIEQASIPTKPTKPNRPKIIMAGSFGGFAFGAGLVVLFEMLDNSIRTAADVKKYVQLKPIAEIPYVSTIAERQRGRWRFAFILAVLIGLVAGMLAAIHFYYMPLDVLADLILQQINIRLPISRLIAH